MHVHAIIFLVDLPCAVATNVEVISHGFILQHKLLSSNYGSNIKLNSDEGHNKTGRYDFQRLAPLAIWSGWQKCRILTSAHFCTRAKRTVARTDKDNVEVFKTVLAADRRMATAGIVWHRHSLVESGRATGGVWRKSKGRHRPRKTHTGGASLRAAA